MHLQFQRKVVLYFLAFVPCGAMAQHQAGANGREPMRLPTVVDSIEMMQVGGDQTVADDRVNWSPDGQMFVVITHRGDLETNTNEYFLLLFRCGACLRSSPEVLLKWASSSNNPAISNIRWLRDNKTILFVGEKPGQRQQIFAINVKTKRVVQRTHHPTDIITFDTTADMRTIAYLARPPVAPVFDHTSITRGLVVSNQHLADLLVGHGQVDKWALYRLQLFVMKNGHDPIGIAFPNPETPIPRAGVILSPDGCLAVIMTNTYLYAAPDSWKGYRSFDGYENGFLTYRVINTKTQSVKPLLQAPISAVESIAWAPDSRSIAIGATYLPLDVEDPNEREARETSTWAVEVKADTGDFRKIADGSYSVLNWDASTNVVLLKSINRTIAYRKLGDRWEKAKSSTIVPRRDIDVQLEQDINTPPRLLRFDLETGSKSVLMEINPQFRSLRFSHVDEITWKSRDGVQYRGGLYLPADYVPGRKYPFIVQTHGWNSQEFSFDGWSTAGYAAQALASTGFVVAQVPLAQEFSTTKEGPRNMAMYEGLIDSLDELGMIDRAHVGLLGWSRTGYHVRYTLAFSKYLIGAAVVADGMDGGYWQYIAEANSSSSTTYDGQNGAPPFGEGLQQWFRSAPSFNLDKVQSAVRELGFGQYSFEYNWEMFAGLKRLGKPVELIWLPAALHAPVKPLERMVAQQGSVDWFCFWLKGEEDPDPEKVEQYKRWRELRKMQIENDAKDKAAKEPAPLN